MKTTDTASAANMRSSERAAKCGRFQGSVETVEGAVARLKGALMPCERSISSQNTTATATSTTASARKWLRVRSVASWLVKVNGRSETITDS